MKPVTYDPAGCYLDRTGISAASLRALAPRLEAARHEVLVTDLELYRSGAQVSKEKEPLDAGFLELPRKLLDDYRSNREASELYRILKAAHRLRDLVDRVVVLGIG